MNYETKTKMLGHTFDCLLYMCILKKPRLYYSVTLLQTRTGSCLDSNSLPCQLPLHMNYGSPNHLPLAEETVLQDTPRSKGLPLNSDTESAASCITHISSSCNCEGEATNHMLAACAKEQTTNTVGDSQQVCVDVVDECNAAESTQGEAEMESCSRTSPWSGIRQSPIVRKRKRSSHASSSSSGPIIGMSNALCVGPAAVFNVRCVTLRIF